MNTINQSAVRSGTSSLTQILFVALIGAVIVFASGLAQSQTLHDAAHDMRHTTGFPCH